MGYYPQQEFVHIDVRGSRAPLDGLRRESCSICSETRGNAWRNYAF
ncbi:MAG: hypothetical protein HC888_19060 [Candidatus Competibacteraceae bacterium]|nr:hypothetical protein [Candidatus Competibacteraceae bacterium]